MTENTAADADLELNRFGSRFADANAEKVYRSWDTEDRMPAMLMGGWVAAFSWSMSAILLGELVPGVINAARQVTFGLVVPWILINLLLGHLRGFIPMLRPIFMQTTAATLCMTGFAIIKLGLIFTGTAGGIGIALMLQIFYAPFMRITAGWAMLALTPSVAYGVYLIIQSVDAGTLSMTSAVFFGTVPVMALLTVGFVNLMHDRRSRYAYRDKLVIEHQKALLEQAQGQIRRYMPPAVAKQIIAGNEASIAEPKRQRLTVLFCDIAGFTDMADRVEPEVMTEVLNEYMSSMANLIEQHGGTLNEFAGDGFMALFGAPDAMAPEDQVRSAVAAASEMQAKMPQLNEQWRKLGLGSELKVRIGINTGMVSVGSYGSQGRMTYTAIGLQTNIASRIESKAAAGETLISDASYQLIHDEINCEARGEVECKGVHFPVKVYAPA